ncbi:hypothetical protein [Streptomyces dubilierae]|uniref:Uncharacterized protein n=1 Tax=Streptomyces dubilierae TaxID=3075533 RepID=A0ABU2P7S1_9ACTN|nr:hypothetical protein [Streptomyces sp. DSM 41921]MDT0387877.1 hypothetical protein [Streptomyces sp. DSM 41921]
MTPADLNDWASAGSLGLSAIALVALAVAFADAEPADFDPRPAVRRAIESGRLDPALIAVVNARHAARNTAGRVRRAPRDAAITAAALLMLLAPASPESAR